MGPLGILSTAFVFFICWLGINASDSFESLVHALLRAPETSLVDHLDSPQVHQNEIVSQLVNSIRDKGNALQEYRFVPTVWYTSGNVTENIDTR